MRPHRSIALLLALTLGTLTAFTQTSTHPSAPPTPQTTNQATNQTRTHASFPIHGILTDPTGASVSATPIQLRSAAGALISQTISSDTGTFDFSPTPSGSYLLSIPAGNGFAPQSVPLHLTSRVTGLIVRLVPDSVSQTVNVGAEEALSVEPTANKDTVTVSAQDLRKIPVFDQDFIAALTPFLDAGSISSGGVSILVDGVEVKGATVSPSAIAEVRVNNDPYSAEFGRPGRGRIEILTKPGSPHFHGELNLITRDATFNARNFFATVKPPEQRRIYEGHLTGPVGHGGHTTFLLSEDSRTDDTDSFVHAIGPQGLIDENVPTPRRNTQVSFRVTHDFSEAHRLSVGYNFELDTRHNYQVGGIVLPEAGTDMLSREDDLFFNDRLIFSPTLINQLQVLFEKDEVVTQSLTEKPAIKVDGAFTGGGAQADLSRSENTVHITEVVSWTHKNQYLRFGASIPQISRRAVDDHTNRLGTFSFNSIADYTSPTPNPYVFTSQQGPGRGLYWINEIGGFIQDQIKLTDSLQLSLGLRYQWQTFLSDKKDLAPRASLAYSVNSKTMLRAGAGIFYDRTGGDYPSTFKLHNGLVLRSLQVQNPGYPDPLPPGQSFSSIPTGIVRTAPNIRTPYAIQYSFDIERQLTPKLTLTVGYRGITGVSSFRSRDVNAPILPPNPDLNSTYPRPNPAFGQIQQVESSGRLSSNALDLLLRGRTGHWFSGQAQYTLGRSYDNTAGINAFPQDQYHPNDEWGRSDLDRLHRFNLLGTINPDHWLSLGISATLYSGPPFTETAGLDLFHTGLSNARPPGIGRNTLQAGGTADFDLLWSHDFKLTRAKQDNPRLISVGISAFNVTNHANYTTYIGDHANTTYVGNIRSPLFGQPTTALPGRQMQFSLGYQF